jgi:hypothetical protein
MNQGAAMEDSMVVDAVLWFIFAAVIGLVCCGCVFTVPGEKPTQRDEDAGGRTLDRAA